ncbi:putative actin patch protein 1 [Phaeomoniella chlamydospora]|uniref:Putative actin patch protein 1 n=1 Tax=Phaeomoniella chlamydospora TaxID=158046 RepID=A0A0G2E5Y4_PHACM|nr:putative actin patch protein 1 [Phaeomoniella chlamydospora]
MSWPLAMGKATQAVEETSLEVQTRKAGNFHDFEASLPQIWTPYQEMSLIDKLTSLLGNKNPFYKKARPKDHTIWLLDNTAYRPITSDRHKLHPWQAEFVACYFGQNRKDISKQVAAIADALGIDGKAGQNKQVTALIAERLQPFCAAIAPARTIVIKIPTDADHPQTRELGPSGPNGISSQIIITGGSDDQDGTAIETVAPAWNSPVKGKTHFVGPEGWGVISDIDDSIKFTQTSQPEGILRTTFCEPYQVIEGMPSLYTNIKQLFNPAWFYLSASPYNLYPFLNQFLAEYYPPGTLILRDNSWQNIGGVLKSLTQGVQAYKVNRIQKIHKWLPKRRFICVGDSTQSDPEAYAEIYRKYEGFIQAIFIRKVTNIPNMEEKNKDERFCKAFDGIPSDNWKVFEQPEECEEHLKLLAKQCGL